MSELFWKIVFHAFMNKLLWYALHIKLWFHLLVNVIQLWGWREKNGSKFCCGKDAFIIWVGVLVLCSKRNWLASAPSVSPAILVHNKTWHYTREGNRLSLQTYWSHENWLLQSSMPWNEGLEIVQPENWLLQSSMPRNEGLEIVQPVSKSLNVERNYGRQCMQQSFFEGRGWRVFLGQCCYWSEFLAWMPGCRPVKFSKVSLFWHQNLKSKKVIASKSEEKWEKNVNVMYKNSKAMFVVSKLVSEF